MLLVLSIFLFNWSCSFDSDLDISSDDFVDIEEDEDKLLIYNILDNSLTSSTPLPEDLFSFATTNDGENLYLFANIAGESSQLRFYKYLSDQDTWRRLQEPEWLVDINVLYYLEPYIYGFDVYSNQQLVYSITNDTWEALPKVQNDNGVQLPIIINNKIHLLSTNEKWGLSILYEYNFTTNQWDIVLDSFLSSSDSKFIVVNSNLYILNSLFSCTSGLHSFLKIDIQNKKVEILPNPPFTKVGMRLFFQNSSMVLFGGVDYNFILSDIDINSEWQTNALLYTGQEKQWQQSYCGLTGFLNDDVYEFSFENNSWGRKNSFPENLKSNLYLFKQFSPSAIVNNIQFNNTVKFASQNFVFFDNIITYDLINDLWEKKIYIGSNAITFELINHHIFIVE